LEARIKAFLVIGSIISVFSHEIFPLMLRPTTEFDFELLLRPPPTWGKLPPWESNSNRKFLTFSLPPLANETLNSFYECSQSQLSEMLSELHQLVRVSESGNASDVVALLVDGEEFLCVLGFLYSLSQEGMNFVEKPASLLIL
jgi:hypothetical protein